MLSFSFSVAPRRYDLRQRAGCGNAARPDPCGGPPVSGSYRDTRKKQTGSLERPDGSEQAENGSRLIVRRLRLSHSDPPKHLHFYGIVGTTSGPNPWR
jgi:hypothetical protein